MKIVSFNGKTVSVPDRSALDLTRKIGDDQQLQQALMQQYGLEKMPPSAIPHLREYIHVVDTFSPGVHIAERKFVTFDDAWFGGVTVDFVGMGARNLDGTG